SLSSLPPPLPPPPPRAAASTPSCRLGLGDESSAFVPRHNPNLSELRVLALGGTHSAALTASGEVFTWGYGGFGALGHYVYHRELLPRKVNGPWEGKISHIATRGAHTAAITDSGELYNWGCDEGDRRLGLGSRGGPGAAGSLSVPSKPPWDLEIGDAFIIHYTYRCDYDKGKLTHGKVAESRFDKRSYDSKPPPKNLPLPQNGLPQSVREREAYFVF
ncbi:Os04g0226400, partial [Oryza sativa Japonica Group]